MGRLLEQAKREMEALRRAREKNPHLFSDWNYPIPKRRVLPESRIRTEEPVDTAAPLAGITPLREWDY